MAQKTPLAQKAPLAKAPRKRRDTALLTLPAKSAEAFSPNLGMLSNVMGFVLRQAQIATFKTFIDTFKDLDLRPSQFGILTVIEANPGLTQSELSEALAIKRANLVAMLDTLEQRGVIRRHQPPNDRRSRTLYLTDQGQEFVKTMFDRHNAMERQSAAVLGENGKAQLLTHLHALINALGKELDESTAAELY